MNRSKYLLFFIGRLPIIALLFLFVSPARAQTQKSELVLLRNGASISKIPNAKQWLDSFKNLDSKESASQVVISFPKSIDTVTSKLLEASGIQIVESLPGNNYTAIITKRVLSRELVFNPISITTLQPSWKIIQFPDGSPAAGIATILVSLAGNVPLKDFNDELVLHKGHLLNSPLSTIGFYEVSIPFQNIIKLAGWYGVKSISKAAKDQALNFESTAATKVNIAQLATTFGGYGLLGDGMSIGVGDQSPGVDHVDLRDRIINYHAGPYRNHGMHINGIIGGAGTLQPKAQGFAPHATIIDHEFNLVWARTGTMLQKHNMTVTNNSYAAVVGNCSYSGTYDAYAQALDTLALQYPTVLHVFASGNDGNMNCAPYPAGFGTVTGGYQPAKNILVVGQTDKFYVLGNGSSHGPVRDGRMKPEMMAIGTGVLSTMGGDNYLVSGGTSMACPQVASAGLLLGERYKQLHSGTNASSSLIKALLMNGSMDLGNTGPDYTYGFGMMDLKRSLSMLDSNRYSFGSIATGGGQDFSITVPPNTAQLKAMIYWHDLPASVISNKQLVNDLDLEVVNAANSSTLPLVLDPTPANVNNLAMPGRDRLNNVEQVTIDNPASGNYTIRVKGYDVPGGNQNYVVVYDFVPDGVTLTYPTFGATASSTDSLRIYWDASPDTRPFTLEVSTNNGTSWNILNSNIPAAQRYYVWQPAGISSNQCLLRLARNGSGQQTTAGPFVINPTISLQLAAAQCPGYMNIQWPSVSNATGYQVMLKQGPYLQNQTIVNDTFYTFKGLSLDSTYYASIVPIINGSLGYRAKGISRKANTGNCTGSLSDGDLMVDALLSPTTGRIGTSTQLGLNQNISIRIRNLDDVAASSYTVAYSANGGAWITQSLNPVIGGNSTAIVTLASSLNMNAPGTYTLRVAVKNTGLVDGVPSNDTIFRVVRQLANAPVNLTAGFADGFENTGVITMINDSMGFTPNEHWDYFNSNDTGRLRTMVNSDIVISGSRSISLDNTQYAKTPLNFLTGTFNSAGYSTGSSEVRLEFDYKVHGNTHAPDSNKVWVRGSDTQAWQPLYNYDLTGDPGRIINSGTLSLTDALIAGNQNFSSSTQVRFGQKDTTVIELNDYGTGLTLDNVKIYSVANDLGVDSIIAPLGASCSLNTSPVTIHLINGVAQTVSNIKVFYRLDNGTVVSETIPSLAGKTQLVYTFSQPLTGISPGTHTITTWVAATGDTYHPNDTLAIVFHNQPLITSYPYLENFESGDGFYYASGKSSSWQYGTPNGGAINHAASGVKAWKTSLTGYYNANEASFLYSPCFDYSGLAHPMLSFSGILDIEDCSTTLCDAAWMEYTNDGGMTWTKLGAAGQGFGWYENATAQVWSHQDNTRWKVRSISLPPPTGPVQFRFVLNSDPGTERTGISVDDVHIYSRDYGVYSAATTIPVIEQVSGSQFIDFIAGGNIIAQIKANGQNIGSTEVNVYKHTPVDTVSGQYYLPRSFMINSATQPSDSITARLFVPDADVDSLVNAAGCSFCTKPSDVYRLGISKYDDTVRSNENGSLLDNVSGLWTYIGNNKVKWVPYDSGYYAEVRIPSFSEFWFNDGGPQGNLSLPIFSLGSDRLVGIYPNPNTNGRINIAWTSGLEQRISVELTDMMGRVLKREYLAAHNGNNVGVLEAGNLPSGVYFVRCLIGQKLFVEKIVFQ